MRRTLSTRYSEASEILYEMDPVTCPRQLPARSPRKAPRLAR